MAFANYERRIERLIEMFENNFSSVPFPYLSFKINQYDFDLIAMEWIRHDPNTALAVTLQFALKFAEFRERKGETTQNWTFAGLFRFKV